MKNNKKLGKSGGFYIALCSCAAVIALAGYAGNIIKGGEKEEKIAFEDIDENEIITDEVPLTAEPEREAKVNITVNKPEIVTEPESVIEQPETEDVAAAEEVDEFMPQLPVDGKVLAEFSGDKLIYFEKLGDWRAHNGIDLEAAEGDDVYVCENGVVEKIFQNNLGGNILVDHKNGYKSLYANLSDTDLVKVGDELKAGETIARVGKGAVGDKTDGAHVHFEIICQDKEINPLDIITIE